MLNAYNLFSLNYSFVFLRSSLLINSNTDDAGSLILQNPITDPDGYCNDESVTNFGDKIFKNTCCSELLIGEDTCGKYFKRRPRNDCQGYVPPTHCNH